MFNGLEQVLAKPDTQLRLFGKPEVSGRRRMGVTLALDESIEKARSKARTACQQIQVTLD